MTDYTIYALRAGCEDFPSRVLFESLKKGVGRFGWSYDPKGDLHKLKNKIEASGWSSLTDDERECYQPFLLDFKDNDYVVYINMPEYGRCTLAKITGPYFWPENPDADFNHCFPVAPDSVCDFDRSDAIVHPFLRSKLKLQRRWWRINAKQEFETLVQALREGEGGKARQSPETSIAFLNKEMDPWLLEITRRIQKTHPNFDLEKLVAEIFKRTLPSAEIKIQGQSGSSGDFGADIIVSFEGGLPFGGLETPHKCVVQVKSHIETDWDTKSIEDIKRAFKKYPDADMGLIISTAENTSEHFDQELEKARAEDGKPIGLIVGSDVARFLLQHGADLIRGA